MILKYITCGSLKKDRFFPLGFLLMSFSFFFLYDMFAVTPTFNIILWALTVFFLFRRKMERPKPIKILFLILIFLVFLNIRKMEMIKNNLYNYTSLIIVGCTLLMIHSKEIHLSSYRILLIPCIIYVAVRCLYLFDSELFLSYLEIISPRLQIFSNRMIVEGYGVPITLNISLTEYYLFFGFNYLLISCYKKVMDKQNISIKEILGILILIWAIFSLKRRTAVVAFLVTILMFFFFILSKKGKGLYMILLAGFSCGIALTLYIFLRNHVRLDNRIWNTVISLAEGNDVSTGRFALYRKAIEVFQNHMVSGIGWNGFSQYSITIDPNVSNVHNLILQLLCETGLIITSIIILLLSIFFYFTLLYLKRADSIHKPYLLFTFNCLIFFFTASMFDNVIYTPNGWITILIGILPLIKVESEMGRNRSN